jgi:hypothetical protein
MRRKTKLKRRKGRNLGWRRRRCKQEKERRKMRE